MRSQVRRPYEADPQSVEVAEPDLEGTDLYTIDLGPAGRTDALPQTPYAGSPELPPNRVVILGAGRNMRGGLPTAVSEVGRQGCVLDWLLSAFAVLTEPDVHFVGGYMAGTVRERFPQISFDINPDWESTGPARSLSIAPLASSNATYVSYADVVFRPQIVRLLEAAKADLVVAIDSQWRVRYEGRSRSEMDGAEKVAMNGQAIRDIGKHIASGEGVAEFAGLLKLSGPVALRLHNVITSGAFKPTDGLPEVIRFLVQQGVSTAVVDVNGQWAELNAPQDLARFVLGTKAESLERLRPLLVNGYIGESVSFTHEQWENERPAVLNRIEAAFGGKRVIVRSSALSEDSWLQSSAGAYTSVLDVPASDTPRLAEAIECVLRSYSEPRGLTPRICPPEGVSREVSREGIPAEDACGKGFPHERTPSTHERVPSTHERVPSTHERAACDPADQVLVQEMLHGVTMSGVVMTRTPSLGAPYYVINYDNTSRRTDTVTSGEGTSVRTMFLHRGMVLRPGLPTELYRLMVVIREIEQLVGHDSLDIEFAFTQDGTAHVLQVRPIAVAHANQPVNDSKINDGIRDAVRFFRELQRPRPHLLGRSTQLSVMSDWNPAEIVGTKPSRLAFSLYRYLITDETWARQRAEYGYRDVRPCNLLVDVLGHPYIDVRATFNSFIPASLPDDLASRLLEHYLDLLSCQPELHDKVEFEVLFTCMDFDFDRKADRLRQARFSEREILQIRSALAAVTRKGIARCENDWATLDEAQRRFEAIRSAHLPPLEKAFLWLEDARQRSVLAFAHLARAGFVAATLMRSLCEQGIITVEQKDAFLASVRTVSSRLQQDARAVAAGEMSFEAFVDRYGHLRPGTYDITSPNYANAAEDYLRPLVTTALNQDDADSSATNSWDNDTRAAVDRALQEMGLGVGIDAFEQFVRRAIEGREYSKFVFTRNLSAAIEALAEFGAAHFVSREEMANIRIQDLFQFRGATAESVSRQLKLLAAEGRAINDVTQAVCLPGQIRSELDMVCFEQLRAQPNFITQKKVRAETVCLSNQPAADLDLTGRIVITPNADPGFDWIFSRRIAGLLTMYGGANSHMAIRAAEFQLPAATGVGETIYEQASKAELIELDCASRQIRIVR